MQTVNSQSLLAKLLASENISVQYTPGVKTAMFDLKNRVLIMPIWQDITQDLEHLLLGHETGHAIDTPTGEEYKAAYEGIAKRIFGEKTTPRLSKTVAGFLNVIEDARIDKRQKRRFPGLRKNYLAGYKELIERNFFGTNGRDVNSLSFIDRANIYFKGGSIHFKIDFTPEERSLLKQIENAEKWEDVVALTEEVYRFCKGQIENAEHDLEIPVDDEGGAYVDEYDSDNYDSDSDDWDDEESDSEDGEGSEVDEDGDDESESDNDGKSDAEQGEGDLNPESEEKKQTQSKHGAGAEDESDGLAPESETDNAYQNKIQELVRDVDTDYVYTQLPDIEWKNVVHDYKKVLSDWRRCVGTYNLSKEVVDNCRRNMTEWRRKEKDTISFLVKEFEQRKSAEIYSRTSIAKTGTIDTNKLHSYRYNDDIFRRLSVIPEGKNHGFVMFLDWSGSMDYGLKYTIRQLLTLVLFCKQIQVPFEVYAFKDSDAVFPWKYGEKKNVIQLGNIVLRQFLSSRMSLTELNDAMTFLWAMGAGYRILSDTRSGTPLNEAIILAPKVVNDFRAKFKLEIVNTIFLTDGDSNGFNGLKNESANREFKLKSDGTIAKTRYLYTDKFSGKTYDITPYGWGNEGQSNTAMLLKCLKEQTGCNLIGFFLFSESWHKFTHRFKVVNSDYAYQQKVTKFWKENKFFPVKSEGYDDYYVIDARALKNNDEGALVIDTTKSNKQMAKQFAKFASKKAVNRVLLRNFIDHVTGQANLKKFA